MGSAEQPSAPCAPKITSMHDVQCWLAKEKIAFESNPEVQRMPAAVGAFEPMQLLPYVASTIILGLSADNDLSSEYGHLPQLLICKTAAPQVRLQHHQRARSRGPEMLVVTECIRSRLRLASLSLRRLKQIIRRRLQMHSLQHLRPVEWVIMLHSTLRK